MTSTATPTLTPAVVGALIGAAIRAPSSHNTRPWRFRVTDEAVELRADRTRALPVNDPHDRELAISCGAALCNLRLAAGDAGCEARVELQPDAAEPDLLARVTLAPSSAAPSPLLAALGTRRTFRKSFTERELPPGLAAELESAALLEGAVLDVVGEPERRASVAALARGSTGRSPLRHPGRNPGEAVRRPPEDVLELDETRKEAAR